MRGNRRPDVDKYFRYVEAVSGVFERRWAEWHLDLNELDHNAPADEGANLATLFREINAPETIDEVEARPWYRQVMMEFEWWGEKIWIRPPWRCTASERDIARRFHVRRIEAVRAKNKQRMAA